MGRPSKSIPPVKKHITIGADLLAQVELKLYSPALGKIPYGAWQTLIEALLRNWLESQNDTGN